ncbi:hypothetical protein WMY93_014568 [Mugilogobius chulae]|uniref:Leucine rich adaptor protein 1-like n=1 Tax=Mugilogobius chulae TaxID=88201 RepID=A0AAW0NVV8_9GOBI
MDEDSNVLPELKDLETKLGRKVPDGLVRSLVGGKHHDKHEKTRSAKFCAKSADFKRLESKMLLLKQEMANLRAIDVKLMQQLMTINEGIESIRWMMEDKGALPDGSSFRGSMNSLNDANSDNLDGLSVGSYLDTLEDIPDDPSPTDLSSFMEKTVINGDAFSKTPLKLRVESDEYYCFG